VEELNAREEVGCHLALAASTRSSQRIEEIVAAALVADRRYRPLQ
jgi:hypothetical protein